MKVSTYFVTIVSFSTSVSVSNSFQVEPDRAKIFKNAIETTVDQPVLKQIDSKENSINPSISSPMLTIFDDDAYSPVTPAMGAFMSSVSNVFQGKGSVKIDVHSHRPRPLFESVDLGLQRLVSPTKRTVPRKQFACDDNPDEYWFHNRIHSFGNTGFLGAVHAACAPVATKLIDLLAYEKHDIRSAVSDLLRNKVINKSRARVLDLCCGVGISTRALKAAFHDAEAVIGLDTSPEMIATARAWTRHEIAIKYMKNLFNQTKMAFVGNDLFHSGAKVDILEEITNAMFARGNAERTIFPDKSFDLVTIMYGFHEIPKLGRYRILREVRRLLQNGGTLALIDIVPEYQPSESMLLGEPYVLEYQRNIHAQMENIQGFTDLKYKVLLPGHVGMWLLTRKSKSSKGSSSSLNDDRSVLSKKLPF